MLTLIHQDALSANDLAITPSQIYLSEGPNYIGRAPEQGFTSQQAQGVSVQAQGVSVQVDDFKCPNTYISRLHAIIIKDSREGTFQLSARGMNGVFINQVKVEEAFLKEGDIIVFGGGSPNLPNGAILAQPLSSLVYTFSVNANVESMGPLCNNEAHGKDGKADHGCEHMQHHQHQQTGSNNPQQEIGTHPSNTSSIKDCQPSSIDSVLDKNITITNVPSASKTSPSLLNDTNGAAQGQSHLTREAIHPTTFASIPDPSVPTGTRAASLHVILTTGLPVHPVPACPAPNFITTSAASLASNPAPASSFCAVTPSITFLAGFATAPISGMETPLTSATDSLSSVPRISNTFSSCPTLAGRNPHHLLSSLLSEIIPELLCGVCKCLISDVHVLECGHSFCGGCVKISANAACPVCSKPMAREPCHSFSLNKIIDIVKILVSNNSSSHELTQQQREQQQHEQQQREQQQREQQQREQQQRKQREREQQEREQQQREQQQREQREREQQQREQQQREQQQREQQQREQQQREQQQREQREREQQQREQQQREQREREQQQREQQQREQQQREQREREQQQREQQQREQREREQQQREQQQREQREREQQQREQQQREQQQLEQQQREQQQRKQREREQQEREQQQREQQQREQREREQQQREQREREQQQREQQQREQREREQQQRKQLIFHQVEPEYLQKKSGEQSSSKQVARKSTTTKSAAQEVPSIAVSFSAEDDIKSSLSAPLGSSQSQKQRATEIDCAAETTAFNRYTSLVEAQRIPDTLPSTNPLGKKQGSNKVLRISSGPHRQHKKRPNINIIESDDEFHHVSKQTR